MLFSVTCCVGIITGPFPIYIIFVYQNHWGQGKYGVQGSAGNGNDLSGTVRESVFVDYTCTRP